MSMFTDLYNILVTLYVLFLINSAQLFDCDLFLFANDRGRVEVVFSFYRVWVCGRVMLTFMSVGQVMSSPCGPVGSLCCAGSGDGAGSVLLLAITCI